MMNIRTDDQFDNIFVEELLSSYYHSSDEKERVAYRKTITECLIPLVASIVRKWSDYDLEDLFQGAILDIMENAIPKWTPNSGNVGGYFRRCVSNYCYTVTDQEEKKSASAIDDAYESIKSTYLEDVFIEPIFNTEDENRAYITAIQHLLVGDIAVERLVKILKTNSNLSLRKLVGIISHANVTVKEMLVDKVVVECQYDISDKTKLFNRLASYINPSDMKKVIQIFGGTTVVVPKGWYNGREDGRNSKSRRRSKVTRESSKS